MTGFEPLLYLAAAFAVGPGGLWLARWAARETRWRICERRAQRDWQTAMQPAYETVLAEARRVNAARADARALLAEARTREARKIRPVGTPLDIYNGRP